MYAMSVNDVPGWLVTMPPRAIGVPDAWTPGFVPHCDVLTAEVLPEAVPPGEPPEDGAVPDDVGPDDVVLDEPLLQPASITAAVIAVPASTGILRFIIHLLSSP
jgi:hypothetical protein